LAEPDLQRELTVTTATLTSPFADLTTLDPRAGLDDLEFVRDLAGDARVVAIGESTHYTHEFYLLRHRLTRFLIERLGFTAIAFESGFTEASAADEWIGGGGGELAQVQAAGLTYLFGECAEMGAMLTWLRQLNSARPRPARFYGIDLPASCGSLQPALRAVQRYLAEADPAQVPRLARLGELAASYVRADPRCDSETRRALRAYCARPKAERDELTGLLADLTARFDAVELQYRERTGTAAYDRARQQLRVARQLDTWLRDNATAAAGEHPFFDINIRDASMAQTVEWILAREERLVVLAHNLHIQRTPYGLSWLSETGADSAASSLGHHLAGSLGRDYRVIGTTFSEGEVVGVDTADDEADATGWNVRDVVRQLGPAAPDSIDGLIAAVRTTPGVLDLRTLTAGDAALIGGSRPMRSLDQYVDVAVTAAFDALAHVPAITLWHSSAMPVLLQDEQGGP
jgi:erythromycin esterase